MNEITVSMAGNVATEPEQRTTKAGDPMVTFRLVVNEQRYDSTRGTYEDLACSFLSVSAFRGLAVNLAASVHKGQPVVVTGRLRVGRWTTGEGEVRTSPEVTAYHVGHDLKFGQSSFSKPQRSAGYAEAGSAPAPSGPSEGPSTTAATPADATDAVGAVHASG